jgi:hypothetical protein
MRSIILKDGTVIKAKFTVEERTDGIFIATIWYPTECSEHDRNVEEFETYSAALANMYRNALYTVVTHINLFLIEE